jgi:hypothetical protein
MSHLFILVSLIVVTTYRAAEMRKVIVALCLITISCQSARANEISAAELVSDIYQSCVSQFSTRCIKPKALAWISRAANQDTIKLTSDLSIVRTGEDEFDESRSDASPIVKLFDRVDSFLTSHSLRMEAPQLLKNEEARALIPRSLLKGGIADGLEVALVEGNAVEGNTNRKEISRVTP